MMILAVDTATTTCSVAVVKEQLILCEETCNNGKTHSVNLMKLIIGLLGQLKINLNDLYGFAVSIGPGTFTGLRIGISTIKGLAYGFDKPVVGVNSLDALAFPFKESTVPVVSIIDARRGEVYYACYKFIQGRMHKFISCGVISPKKLVSIIPIGSILIGSGAVLYSKIFENKVKMVNFIKKDNYNIIKASSIAFLAAKKFAKGNTDKISTLVPYYIRKSDAEINRIF